MNITNEQRVQLEALFQKIKLYSTTRNPYKAREKKVEQIMTYLDIIHTKIRKLSRKRALTFVDCGAGNCFLSFLVYFFYSSIEKRNISIYCIDTNNKLMENAADIAKELGFTNMHFITGDILSYQGPQQVEGVYSLHACDSATDKMLYLGYKVQAKYIFSVSCCQHSLKDQLKRHPYKGMTRHSVFKDKIIHMLGDSLRGLLLETKGYDVDIFEFISARYTGKNIMLRAERKNALNKIDAACKEYDFMKKQFGIAPKLELYLNDLTAALT